MLEAAALAVVFLALQANTQFVHLLYCSPAVRFNLGPSTPMCSAVGLLQQHTVQQQFESGHRSNEPYLC